nr:MAG TPA: hypothetical protein [Caudoviricetes sp.]
MRYLLTCQYSTLKKDSPQDNGADTVNKVRAGKRKAPVSGGPAC